MSVESRGSMVTGPRRAHRHEDRGAALIVAIGFVLMIGAITAGLSSLVTSSMNNRVSLQGLRDREYAADGAIQDGIAAVRTHIDAGGSTCGAGGDSLTSTVNSTQIRVEWAYACATLIGAEGLVLVQHNATFAACEDTSTPCATGSVIIRAEVNFELDPSGIVAHTYIQGWSVKR